MRNNRLVQLFEGTVGHSIQSSSLDKSTLCTEGRSREEYKQNGMNSLSAINALNVQVTVLPLR